MFLSELFLAFSVGYFLGAVTLIALRAWDRWH